MGLYRRYDRRMCFVCGIMVPDNRYCIHMRTHTQEEKEAAAPHIEERIRTVQPGWTLLPEGEGEQVIMVRVINT